jgi:hypothetical protein
MTDKKTEQERDGKKDHRPDGPDPKQPKSYMSGNISFAPGVSTSKRAQDPTRAFSYVI